MWRSCETCIWCHCQSDILDWLQLPIHVLVQMGTDASDLETAHVRLVAVCCRPRTEISARWKCYILTLGRRRSTSGLAVRSSVKHRNWTALLHDRSVSALAADRSTSTAIRHLRFVSGVSGVYVACCGQQMCASFRWAVLLLIEVKLVVVLGWIWKVGGVRGDARARGGFV